MTTQYKNSLKKKLCEEICLFGKSTLKTAKDYSIPLKTLEKWITAFHKDDHCFDLENDFNDFKIITNDTKNFDDYNDFSNDELKKELMRKDIEIARLKKAYLVEGGGMEEKVFISLSKKNTK